METVFEVTASSSVDLSSAIEASITEPYDSYSYNEQQHEWSWTASTLDLAKQLRTQVLAVRGLAVQLRIHSSFEYVN